MREIASFLSEFFVSEKEHDLRREKSLIECMIFHFYSDLIQMHLTVASGFAKSGSIQRNPKENVFLDWFEFQRQ